MLIPFTIGKKMDDRIFSGKQKHFTRWYQMQRKKVAEKLQNPRLLEISFRIRKIREGFIQFYYNEDNGKTSMALIVKGRRVYGRDYAPKRGWHRHVLPDGNHNYSEEGRRPITVERFMREVDEVIKEKRQQQPT